MTLARRPSSTSSSSLSTTLRLRPRGHVLLLLLRPRRQPPKLARGRTAPAGTSKRQKALLKQARELAKDTRTSRPSSHRQEQAALLAASGLQRPPAQTWRGQTGFGDRVQAWVAVQWSLQILHPLTAQPDLSSELIQNVDRSRPRFGPSPFSASGILYWKERALALMEASDRVRFQIQLFVIFSEEVQIMLICNLVLLLTSSSMMRSCTPLDVMITSYAKVFVQVSRSWEKSSARATGLPTRSHSIQVHEAGARAREFRKKIFRRCTPSFGQYAIALETYDGRCRRGFFCRSFSGRE